MGSASTLQVFCQKQLCLKYKSSVKVGYAEGIKRCQHCEIFIKWDGIKCPCCDRKLRSKPRDKTKAKVR